MKRQLLLISNSTIPGEPYLGWCKAMINDFFVKRGIKTALFIPYAGVSMTYDQYLAKVAPVMNEMNVQITSIHQCNNPVDAVETAECIIVGGGSTWHLLHEVQRLKLVEPIRKKIQEGIPYMGWSAGSNLCCPTIKTTNDMPIIEPESFNALNVIPFQINPHYLDAHVAGHGGETREDRIKEFMVVNADMYVAGLREATALLVEEDNMSLIGREKDMRVFKFNTETKEYPIGSDVNFLLK